MYFNVVGKAPDATVAKMMDDDAKQVKHDARAAVVVQADPIKIGDVSVPSPQPLRPGAVDRYEAVAYIGQEKVLVMATISSKNEALFKRDYPAFVQLIQSDKWLSSNVTIEHSGRCPDGRWASPITCCNEYLAPASKSDERSTNHA